MTCRHRAFGGSPGPASPHRPGIASPSLTSIHDPSPRLGRRPPRRAGHQARSSGASSVAGTSMVRTRRVPGRTPGTTAIPTSVTSTVFCSASAANVPASTKPAAVMIPPVTARSRSVPPRVPSFAASSGSGRCGKYPSSLRVHEVISSRGWADLFPTNSAADSADIPPCRPNSVRSPACSKANTSAAGRAFTHSVGARLLRAPHGWQSPTKAAQTAARSYFYASPAVGVNFRFCRDEAAPWCEHRT